MRIVRAIIAIMALSLITTGTYVLAADVSGAVHSGIVRCSNNGTSTAGNVSGAVGFNTTTMIAAGIVAANGSDLVLQKAGGGLAVFMPGPGYLAVLCEEIAPSGNEDLTLYSNSSGGNITYFPGATGLTVNHSDSMPDGTTNFSINWTGRLDENAIGLLVGQSPAWSLTYNGTDGGSVNFTAAQYDFTDDFDTDDFTDVGSKIKVDAVTDERLEFESERSVTDTRTYYDVLGTTVDDNNWRLDLTLHVSSSTDAGAEFVFGLTELLENENSITGDALYFRVAGTSPTIFTKAYDEGASTTGTSITIANGVTYYVSLAREDTNNLTLEVYTDEARTTHVSGSPQDHDITAATIVNLDYIQGSNANNGGGASKEQVGWIDDIGFTDGTTGAGTTFSATATPGYGTFALMGDGTRIRFYDRDGQDTGNVTVGTGLPHSVSDYQFTTNHTFDYVDSISVYRGGNIKGSWVWEWGDEFTDGSGEGNTGYPSWREDVVDTDVTMSLLSFGPITLAENAGAAAVTWPSMAGTTPPDTPSTMYTENATPGIFFAGLINSVWSLTGLPTAVFWYNWAFSIIIGAGILVYYFFAVNKVQALLIKLVVMGAFMTFFALPGPNIFGFVVVIYWGFWAFGAQIMAKSFGW